MDVGNLSFQTACRPSRKGTINDGGHDQFAITFLQGCLNSGICSAKCFWIKVVSSETASSTQSLQTSTRVLQRDLLSPTTAVSGCAEAMATLGEPKGLEGVQHKDYAGAACGTLPEGFRLPPAHAHILTALSNSETQNHKHKTDNHYTGAIT